MTGERIHASFPNPPLIWSSPSTSLSVTLEDIPLWDPDAKKQEGKHSNIMEPQKDASVISKYYSTGAYGGCRVTAHVSQHVHREMVVVDTGEH